jgi:hypothetical protein
MVPSASKVSKGTTVTGTKNFLLRLSPELGEQVDHYRYSNRIPSSARALRELIRLGLDGAPTAKPNGQPEAS